MTDDLQADALASKYNLEMKPGRDYRIRENHWLPRKLGVRYLAFGKTLYSDREIAGIPDHEFLHVAQFDRYGIPRVVAHYLFHFAKNYLRCLDLARSFVEIPFEVEARSYEKSMQEGQSCSSDT